MKVMLAGRRGRRISEEPHMCRVPIVEIWGRPVLLRVMKYYSFFGCNDFILVQGICNLWGAKSDVPVPEMVNIP